MEAEILVVGAAIVRDGRCLVTQRGVAMSMPLQWEFPGGKVEPGETAKAALAREIREELALQVEIGRLLATGRDARPQRSIVLEVYAARLVGGTLRLREHARSLWAKPAEMAALRWAAADLEPARVVASELRRGLL